jgi:hypothetical protein
VRLARFIISAIGSRDTPPGKRVPMEVDFSQERTRPAPRRQPAEPEKNFVRPRHEQRKEKVFETVSQR